MAQAKSTHLNLKNIMSTKTKHKKQHSHKSKKQQKSKHAAYVKQRNKSRERKIALEKANFLSTEGIELATSDQYKEAIEKFEQAVKIYSGDVEIWFSFGLILVEFEQYETAIKKLERALQINPKHVETLVEYGAALTKIGQYERAIEKFKQALEIEPNLVEALYSWGAALDESGQHKAAIEKFEQALQSNPEALLVLSNYGSVLEELGQYEDAIDKFKKILQINPNDSGALGNYGIALSHLGQYEAAFEKYEQAIQIDPDDSAVFNNYGFALLDFGQYREAIEKFEKALDMPSIPQNRLNLLHLILGVLYYQIKSEEQGDNYFKLAIQHSDDKDAARIQVAQQLFAENPYSEKGVEILQEITETSPHYQEAFKSMTLDLTPKAFFEMFNTRSTDDETLKDTELLNRTLYHKISNEIAILNEILHGIVFEFHIEDDSFAEILKHVSDILGEIRRRRDLEKTQVKEIPADDYDAIMSTISKTAQDISDFVNNELAVLEEDIRFLLDNSSNKNVPSEELEEVLAQIRITEQALNDLKSINEGITIRYSRFPVEQLFENWRHTPKLRHATITLDIQNGDSEFYGDEQKIKSFLKELVENSLRHNPEHKDLQIRLTSKDDMLRTSLLPDERKYLVITYHDNGKGIPPDKEDWVFLPLNTTSDVGSGLGLFMIKRTVEKMKGYISVETDTEGATFEIAIPYSQGDEQ